MLTVKRLSVTVAVAATAALGVAGTSAIAGDEAAPVLPAPSSPAATTPAPIGAVQPEQARTLAVLARPQRASDAVPAEVATDAAGPGRFGRNPELSRAITTPAGRGWVVPGDDVICLVLPDPVDGYATTCGPTQTVAAKGLTLALVDEQATTAVTVVPPDAEVVATTPEGDRETLEPNASGVVAVSDASADKVTVVTDEGRSTTNIPTADEVVGAPAP